MTATSRTWSFLRVGVEVPLGASVGGVVRRDVPGRAEHLGAEVLPLR